MKLTSIICLLGILILTNSVIAQAPSLRINEVSQGSGAQEYVEFVVIGQMGSNCTPATLDLRKWIFDDNNGRFASGSGKGIADGSVRFANNSFWQAVPVGTTILIYDDNDYDSNIIPSNDVSLSDGNCRLVLPISSNLFEKNEFPKQGSPSYPQTGWTSGGSWSGLAMSNSNDSFQIIDPNNPTVAVHSISYGNNTNNSIIYFSGSAGGKVFYMDHTINNDYSNQNNWISRDIALAQTPGAPNNAANASFLSSLNPSCSTGTPPPPFTVTATATPVNCPGECTGEISLVIAGGVAPYSYVWSTNDTQADLDQLCEGSYDVTVTDQNGCQSQASAVIIASNTNCNGGPTPPVTPPTDPNDSTYLLEFPNVITPNGDGINDLFKPSKFHNVQVESFIILNRWGNILFESNELMEWNPSEELDQVSDGVYFYKVDFKNPFGRSETLHGFFHIIRGK